MHIGIVYDIAVNIYSNQSADVANTSPLTLPELNRY